MKRKAYSYIRFSTPDQIKGDSLNRQLQLSKNYAKINNLTLDKSISLHDFGISAFKGQHTTKGALGQFLKLVADGRISKGSFLLVESLDRLSREQVLDAFDQFRDIIRNGITIVTLTDNQEYSEQTLNTNISSLMMSLTIMSRAHEESLIKSKRLKSAWKTKRKNLSVKKLTAKCPAWLTLNKKEQIFTVISGRAEIIQKIFSMYLSGKGTHSICKTLNQLKIKTWGKSKTGWHISYIKKIIENRATIGEFQPHTMLNGKREPEGDPILNYFPKVIKPSTFYKAQEKRKQWKIYKGRTGIVSNLFRGIAKCGNCTSNMVFVNKGKPPKGGQYLVCSDAIRGHGCKYRTIRYNEFEETFLKYCLRININDLISGNDERETKANKLKDEFLVIKSELEITESRINNLTDDIVDENDKRIRKKYRDKLTSLFDNQESLKSKQKDIGEELYSLEQVENSTASKLSDITKLIEHMNKITDDERIDFRLKLRSKIGELIKKITVFPDKKYPKYLVEFCSETSITLTYMKEVSRLQIMDN